VCKGIRSSWLCQPPPKRTQKVIPDSSCLLGKQVVTLPILPGNIQDWAKEALILISCLEEETAQTHRIVRLQWVETKKNLQGIKKETRPFDNTSLGCFRLFQVKGEV
jgi:hypothetical protein